MACLLPLIIVSCSHKPKTEKILIDNLHPRRDVNGQIIDAHGGCLQAFNGTYYLYGNKFGTNHNDVFLNCPFSVYSSPNLRDWTYVGNLLKGAPNGYYYRPYVVFNPKTKKYVLWYNWYQKLWEGNAGVAMSDSPTGPFVVVNRRAHLSGSSPGDGTLFEDNDGTGYYIYTDIANDYALRVEKLNADYSDTSGQGSGFIGFGVEAPLMFRRHNLYYILAGTLCAACPQGSEVGVEISSSPLGPFTFGGEINHQSGHDMMQASSDTTFEDATNGSDEPSGYSRFHGKKNPFIRAQQTWVAQIPTFAGDPLYIWMADGWYSTKDGTRGHDFQYWSSPLHFNADGSIQPLKFTPRWIIVRAD
ncbi:MAG TPA: family 43 glycosylhydrolase [Candidatus Sulfotelmatobacter sp.]|nr:family 43 glycosylhydrolase [Candidatus Sulfotelmatobacter sp.]